jgi:hypothetical protein
VGVGDLPLQGASQLELHPRKEIPPDEAHHEWTDYAGHHASVAAEAVATERLSRRFCSTESSMRQMKDWMTPGTKPTDGMTMTTIAHFAPLNQLKRPKRQEQEQSSPSLSRVEWLDQTQHFRSLNF